MPLPTPINPGTVVWTGENPGILLKEDPDGPWSALAMFFRIFYSPAGRGSALLLYEKPDLAASLPEACNVMITDNEPMARYLMSDFIARLGNSPFGGSPAFRAVEVLKMTEGYATGDPRTRYTEVIKSDEVEVELIWDELGTPTALELPRELTGARENDLYSLLVESRKPAIILNGRTLPGRPVERVQAGIQTTTAFLYFSETWIKPAE